VGRGVRGRGERARGHPIRRRQPPRSLTRARNVPSPTVLPYFHSPRNRVTRATLPSGAHELVPAPENALPHTLT